MSTAIRKVHGGNGPWVTYNGWEYNAVLIGLMVALADEGPGRPSVDDALFPRLRGPVVAALSLGAAAAASCAAPPPALAAGRDERPEHPGAAPEPASSNGATATPPTASAS